MPISKNKVQDWFIALSIFIAIVVVLGIPFTKWGFKTDDWANILHSKIDSFADLKNLFIEGNMESINHPSGTAPDRGSFLQGLYRPLSFVYYYPQMLLFGTKAYGYFLTTVILHALNAGLFFILLRYFFSLLPALLAALFFGFHPSLQNWLGWISAQTYFIELLVQGIIFLCFYCWLKQHKWWWYASALGLFFINLLLKEAGIVLPSWVFLAILFFSEQPFIARLKNACIQASGFLGIALLYCIIRLKVMPFAVSQTTTLGFTLSWESFLSKQIARCMQFLTYIYDVLGLTWLPKGHRLLNGSILCILLLLFCILFFKSSRKKTILFCFISTIIFSWPGLLMHYQPRYMYMALPWAIAGLTLLLQDFSWTLHWRKFLYGAELSCIGACAIYIFANMKERETALHWLDTEMRKLVYEQLPTAGWHKEPIYFLGLPCHWFDMGTAQAIWFLDNAKTNSYPVYQSGPFVYIPDKNHPRAIPASKQADIKITLEANMFKIEEGSSNLFKLLKPEESLTSIPATLIDQGLWIITWDYVDGRFKILKRFS